MKQWWALSALIISLTATAADDAEQALEAWLQRQSQLRSFVAEVEQQRALATLSRPLVAQGRVWVQPPQHMRWELGQPPQTIAVRAGQLLTVSYPLLDEVEQFSLDAADNPAAQQALALLQAGFPVSIEEFGQNYAFIQGRKAEGLWQFELEPQQSGRRRLLKSIVLEVDAQNLRLLGTVFRFPDGSEMRNRFSAIQENQSLEADLFSSPTQGPGVTE